MLYNSASVLSLKAAFLIYTKFNAKTLDLYASQITELQEPQLISGVVTMLNF